MKTIHKITKSLLIAVFSLLTACTISTGAGEDGFGYEPDDFTVTFNSNGGTPVAPYTSVKLYSIISKPDSKKGYTLVGWYKDEACTDEWVFANDIVLGNITLHAKWSDTYDGSLKVNDVGPAGGKIFYRAPGGFTMTDTGKPCHYLEVAPSDSGSGAQWGAAGASISGITIISSIGDPVDTIGVGRKDTQLIVAHLGTSETGRAAQLCAAATFGGYKDWFLPSIGELGVLLLSGVISSSNTYWSSSEYSSSRVWILNFSTVIVSDNPKNLEYSVRAVRAF